MRRLVVVVLAACSGSSPTPPSPTNARKVPPQIVPAAIPTIVRAGHSSSIEIVATTEDGRAAVTQDAMGGTRLWPTLDGAVEPVVVHLTAVRELAVGRDGDDFVIAGLDPAGALELVRVASTGAIRSRTQILGDAAVEQVAMTPKGVLVLRADQTILMLDPDGHERARLVPPSAVRITSVLARNGHAIALLTEHAEARVHAREIQLDPVAWGKQGPGFSLQVARPMLAPDAKHLAMQTERGVAILDLETGAIGTRTSCVDGRDKNTNATTQDNSAPLGFTDARTLACLGGSRVTWWDLDGTRRAGERSASVVETIAVSNGLTVIADHEALVLARGGTLQWIGYGLANPSMVRTGPLGLTLGHGNQPLLLDRALHARRRYDLGGDPWDVRQLDDVMPLDETHVLVSYADTSNETIVHRPSLVDVKRHVSTPLPFAALGYELHYEPATRLLSLTELDGASLVQLDPGTRTFGARQRIAGSSIHTALHLTDPALARGLVAIAATTENGRVTIEELASQGKARQSYAVVGDLVAVDRAGRIYIAAGETVQVFTGGEPNHANHVTTLATLGRVTIRPSADATQLLVIGDNRLAMFDLDGNQRWVVAAPTAIDGGWIDDEPFVRFSAGLAKLDPATGKLLDRVCAWGFGLSPAPFEIMGDSRSVCDEG